MINRTALSNVILIVNISPGISSDSFVRNISIFAHYIQELE